MRFLVDAQLPPALARWLVSQGHQADHVGDLGLAAAADQVIWDRALADGSAIISKDEDFAQRSALSGHGPPIVWVRLPNVRRREVLSCFETILPAVLAALADGDRLVEVF